MLTLRQSHPGSASSGANPNGTDPSPSGVPPGDGKRQRKPKNPKGGGGNGPPGPDAPPPNTVPKAKTALQEAKSVSRYQISGNKNDGFVSLAFIYFIFGRMDLRQCRKRAASSWKVKAPFLVFQHFFIQPNG